MIYTKVCGAVALILITWELYDNICPDFFHTGPGVDQI